MTTEERVSLRAFAKLDGCDEKLVRRAIEQGRLVKDADGKLPAKLAGTGWRARQPPKASRGADTRQKKSALSAPVAPTRATPPVGHQAQGAAEEPQPQRQLSAAEVAAAGGVPTYAQSAAAKEWALAQKHQLDLQQRAGKLISLEVAKSVFFDEARAVRDALMSWTLRVAPHLASDLGVEADLVADHLGKHVSGLLQRLGDKLPAGLSGPDGR